MACICAVRLQGAPPSHLRLLRTRAGAVLGALCIRADMARRDAWSHAWVDRGTGRLVYVGDGWQPAAHYMAAAYPTEVRVGWHGLGFKDVRWRVAAWAGQGGVLWGGAGAHGV